MHRTYTAEKYRAWSIRIRAARPGIALTTDVIVGFPAKTEDDYAADAGSGRADPIRQRLHLSLFDATRNAGRGDAGQVDEE